MEALYSWTALLKKRRAAAILFSRSESSDCRCEEILVGLQVGIGLGEGEELAERAGQHVLRLRLRRGAAGGDRGVPRLDDRLERAALMGGVALHGLDEVRDEVVALLQLHRDVGPGLR